MTEQRNDGMNDAGDPSLDLPMEYLLHEFEVTPDRGLARLVRTINLEPRGSSLSMTLVLGGQLVTGLLVPAHQWFDDLQAQLGETAHPSDRLLAVFSPQVESYSADKPESGTPDANDEQPVVFMHLRDVVALSGTAQINLAPMRVRLSEVAGWTLGGLDN